MSEEQRPINNEAELSGRERRRLSREASRHGETINGSSGRTAGIWIGVIVLLVLIVGGIIALVTVSNKPILVKLAVPVHAGEWTTGGMATSSISLVEYSDYQCPACGLYYPWLKQLLIDEPEVALTYRNFPLSEIHQNANLAAQAAEAAGRQGQFWGMHDALFKNQSDWSEKTPAEAERAIISYAQALGINLAEFRKDLNSQEIKNKISNDYQTGLESGVNATPSFFLNGTFITNPRSYNDFVQLIKANLASSTANRS